MKKLPILLLIALVSIPGCKKDRKAVKHKNKKTESSFSQIDIPLADDSIRSFFDDDIGEFVLAEEEIPEAETDKVAQNDPATMDDFAWVEAQAEKNEVSKAIYFDFDKHAIKKDQRVIIEKNAELIRQELKEAEKSGLQATVVIEGHACSSAGSRSYNMALSEWRAKHVTDIATSLGIPQESVKTVGRGQEVPALVDGKPCAGDRKEQGPNRRVEMRVIYS